MSFVFITIKVVLFGPYEKVTVVYSFIVGLDQRQQLAVIMRSSQ